VRRRRYVRFSMPGSLFVKRLWTLSRAFISFMRYGFHETEASVLQNRYKIASDTRPATAEEKKSSTQMLSVTTDLSPTYTISTMLERLFMARIRSHVYRAADNYSSTSLLQLDLPQHLRYTR